MADTNFESHVVRGEHGAHEASDINVISISRFGIWISAVTLASMFGMWFLLQYLTHREEGKSPAARPMAAENPMKMPPAPNLQGTPRPDLKEFLAAEQRKAAEYKWVDGEKRIIQIPVQRALELVAKEGQLPVWTPAAVPPAKTPGGAAR